MTVVIPKNSASRLVRWSKNVLLAVGAASMGYCGFVSADTWIYQTQASQLFDHARLRAAAVPRPGMDSTSGLLGRLDIPRLGVSVIVAEGTAETTLRRA